MQVGRDAHHRRIWLMLGQEVLVVAEHLAVAPLVCKLAIQPLPQAFLQIMDQKEPVSNHDKHSSPQEGASRVSCASLAWSEGDATGPSPGRHGHAAADGGRAC